MYTQLIMTNDKHVYNDICFTYLVDTQNGVHYLYTMYTVFKIILHIELALPQVVEAICEEVPK